LPENISFEQGAAIGVPYATAHRALFGKANAQKANRSSFTARRAASVWRRFNWRVRRTHRWRKRGQFQWRAVSEFARPQIHHRPQRRQLPSDVIGMTCGRGFDILLEMVANQNLASDLK
jgi:NADPH2:quinone reductase